MRFLVVGCLLLVTSIAHADHADAQLEDARKLEAQLEYDKALAMVEALIAQGHADPEALVEMHFMAGKLAAGLGRVDVAIDHFARVLTLVPDRTLPDGTSPKITTPFEAARGQTQPLRITAKLVDGRAVATIEADPVHIVAKEKTVVVDHAQEVRAFDVSGNVVWSPTLELFDEHAPPTIHPPEHRPFYKRPLFWGSIAVGTASLAGISAWRFDVAQTQWNDMKAAGADYSALTAVEDRGRRWGLAANIGFGTALLATVATLAVAF